MTNLITLTIPNDDHVALRAFGKALEEMAQVRVNEKLAKDGLFCDENGVIHPIFSESDKIAEHAGIDPADAYVQGCHDAEARLVETDTTAQQVESLAVPGATHIITEQVKVGDPVPVDGGFSQGYNIKTEEIANPVDKTGTPWDERIHSASKALNSDGTWRLRRKPKDMDEAMWLKYIESVKNNTADDNDDSWDTDRRPGSGGEGGVGVGEFDEPPVTLEEAVNVSIEASHAGIAQEFGTGIANAAFTGDHNEPPVTPPGDDFHTDAGVVTEQSVAGIPPIPVPPPVVVPPVPVADEQAWDFPKLMKFLTERHGKIDVPTVNALLAVDGLAALTDLNAHPDKIGPFVARVKAHLGE